jgi:REP-associated tyrosine transposase
MSRPPRLKSFDYTGMHRYFLTVCCDKRAERFVDSAVVELVHAQFRYSAEERQFDIPAYCYMPDHVHALFVGASPEADFKEFVKIAKQRSGFRFKRAAGERLWQEGYYDRVLRGEEATVDVIRYIIENPLRRQLVTEIRDYPFWGSDTHTREALLEFIGNECRTSEVQPTTCRT